MFKDVAIVCAFHLDLELLVVTNVRDTPQQVTEVTTIA
jgi:hypothetical protein